MNTCVFNFLSLFQVFWISNINNIVAVLFFSTLIVLLKQQPNYNQFFIAYLFTNFFFINFNLLNGLNNVHPFFFIFFYFFFFTFERCSFYNKKTNLFLFGESLFFLFFFLIGFILLFLGIYWASQELLWGLWWSWDPIEVYLLLLVLFSIFFFHKFYILFNGNYLQFLFFLFFIFFFVSNKVNLYASIHNFSNSTYLDINIFIFLFFIFFKLVYLSSVCVLPVVLIIFQPTYLYYFVLIFFCFLFLNYKLLFFNLFNLFSFIYLFFSKNYAFKFSFLHACIIFVMYLIVMESVEFFFNYNSIFYLLGLNVFLISYTVNHIFYVGYGINVFYENLLIFTLAFFKCLCVTQFIYNFFIFFYFFLMLPAILIFFFLLKIKIRKLDLL